MDYKGRPPGGRANFNKEAYQRGKQLRFEIWDYSQFDFLDEWLQENKIYAEDVVSTNYGPRGICLFYADKSGAAKGKHDET